MGASDPIAAAARRLNGRRVASQVTARAIRQTLIEIQPALFASTDEGLPQERREHEVTQMKATILVTALLQSMASTATALETALTARGYLERACTIVEETVRKGAHPHG